MRTFVYDQRGELISGFGDQRTYEPRTTADGGVEVDPEELVQLSTACLTTTHHQLTQAGIHPAAIACCSFWHSVLGVDEQGNAATTIIHLFDTRSAGAARALAERTDPRALHARVGAVLHPSYVPAKLFWFRAVYSHDFHRARHWMSFGEYFFLKVLGKPACSTSMASGTGLWQQNQNQYDPELLELIGLKSSHFADPATMDEPAQGLLPEYRSLWPLFDGVPWFPAYGDGACNNIGSGCVSPERFCLMVGTSGAMRAVFEAPEVEVPPGLWCYRVDRGRFVLGGALSNGGGVYAWMRRTLALPPDETLESELAAIAPGSHGLTILPLFAGERSPKWRGDARATFSGMSLNTRPVDMLRAALESVALRFRSLFDIMRTRLAEPEQVIASGGALLRSATWTQMMADALHRPVLACIEQEASSRGAALLALERLGVIAHIRDLPARTGGTFLPNARHREAYEQMLAAQQRLYRKLYEEN